MELQREVELLQGQVERMLPCGDEKIKST